MSVKDHLINLLNALANLSPSRNLISQYVLLLPRDVATVTRSYPELSTENAKYVLQNFFGVEFDEHVVRGEDSFSEALYKHIHEVFDWLNDEDVRTEIAKVLDLPINSIPNPYEEWAKKVLEKLSKTPKGDKIFKFLKIFTRREKFVVHSDGGYEDWEPFLDEVKKKLGLNPAELNEILRLAVLSPDIHQERSGEREISHFGRIAEKIDRYFCHSEYHLDLLIRQINEVSSYGSSPPSRTHYYVLKKGAKETIRKLLEEVSSEPGRT
ncbi:MAG: hypothetical protein QXX87_02710 [Candidatus Jordarchaeales archaeon]